MCSLRYFALVVAWIGSNPSTGQAKSFVYVSVAGENRIAIYELRETDGELKLQGSMKVSGGPGALTVSPDQKFLFASIRSVGNLASFRLDARSGSLTLVNEVVAGADPAYVATDATGKFLLSAYYFAGKVAVHSIDRQGTISSRPIQEVTTDDKAHAIITDRANQFVFVPHTGPNSIFQFRFDAGKLIANDVAKLRRPDKTGPRHIWFHPTRDFAYVSDEQGSSITVYRFDPKNGRLTPMQTVSTLPDGFSRGNSTADIEVHPSGRFVYVANRGHDSIARFQIDSDSGRVTALGQTPTEQTPRSFNIDPSGRFLIAAGESAGKLATYRIDEKSGGLSRLATDEIGKQPWWVLAVRIED
ncbi:MAG: lactonase family protein [Planctomycetes bacterium]|nr:lactonase family protein [Planctomycetota bacterium]